MFEVHTLKYATLATVSRCGMVWFSEDILTTEMVMANYLTKLRNVSLDEGEEDLGLGGHGGKRGTSLLPYKWINTPQSAHASPLYRARGLRTPRTYVAYVDSKFAIRITICYKKLTLWRLSVWLDPGDWGAPEEEVSHPQGHDGRYQTGNGTKLSTSSTFLNRLLLG